ATGQSILIEDVEALLKLMTPVATSADDHKFMHNFVCHSLARGIKLKRWEAQIPPPVLTQRREEPPRSVCDFQKLTLWRTTKQRFVDWLTTHDSLFSIINPIDGEAKSSLLAQSMVFSAMAFGGLCEQDALSALLPAIAKRRVYQAGQHVWIELYFASKRQSITANSVDANTTLRRWFPDGFTLALINYWQKHNYTGDFEANLAANKLMARLLKTLKVDELAKAPLATVGKIASQAYEMDHRDTPSFISAWNTGINEAHSLPHHVWRKLAGAVPNIDDEQPQEPLDDFEEEIEPNTLSHAFDFSQTGNDTDYLGQLRELTKCLRADKTNANDKYTTVQRAVKNLKELIENRSVYFSPAMQLLTHWAYAMLTTGSRYKSKLQVSSVLDYLGVIGKSLVVTLQQENLLMFAPDEFEVLYKNLSEQHARKPKQMANMLARLDEFHAFLVRQFDVAPLELPIKLKGKDLRPTVCANYINEREYRQTKQHIQNNELLSVEDRNGLSCLFTIGYRGGLRIGELSKLMLNDVHWHYEWLLRIRPNQFGSNKTDSAYRLIPLKQLLTTAEFNAFTAYVAYRFNVQEEQNLLLFHQPSTINRKITAQAISQYIVNPLRIFCADKTVTFHTLRHAAINNWYLVLFIKQEDWPFDNQYYPQVLLQNIHLVGVGNVESGRELHAMGMLAGHSSPQETLLSYCHFLDMHQYLAQNAYDGPTDLSLFCRLLKEKEGTIRRDISRKNATLSSQQILKQRTRRQLADWVIQLAQTAVLLAAIDDTPQELFEVDSANIIAITTKYDQGKSLAAIATEVGLPLLDVESVIVAARAIADIKTKKGQSRLIPKRRQRIIQVQYLDAAGQHEAQRTTLSPGMPTDKLVKEDANTILEKLNRFMQSEDLKGDAIWFVNYVINHVSPHKSGVPLYHLDDASQFIYVLRMLVAPSRIYLQHNPVNPKLQPAGYDEQRYKHELMDYLSINERAYCNVGNLRAGSEDQLGKLL
ncbi:MAG: site-specific integrase, partial [Psychrosphaera sp.]|nr:site-specific integrase [Psychrosphaera sp.]